MEQGECFLVQKANRHTTTDYAFNNLPLVGVCVQDHCVLPNNFPPENLATSKSPSDIPQLALGLNIGEPSHIMSWRLIAAWLSPGTSPWVACMHEPVGWRLSQQRAKRERKKE
jgi:hypothetical protein